MEKEGRRRGRWRRPASRVASKLTQFPLLWHSQIQPYQSLTISITTSQHLESFRKPLAFCIHSLKVLYTLRVGFQFASSVSLWALRLSLPAVTAKYSSYCGVHLLFSSVQVNISNPSLYKCFNPLALHTLFSCESCESCLPQVEKFNADVGCLLLSRIVLCEGSACCWIVFAFEVEAKVV